MKFKATFKNYNILNNGDAKIPLQIPADEYRKIEAMMSNFRERDLTVEFLIDAEAEKEKLFLITDDQRKKIYALIADIAETLEGITRHNKVELENFKARMKSEFISSNPIYKPFSLSDCRKELAHDFIEWLLIYAMLHDVALSQNYADDDKSDNYFYMCIAHKKCAVCQSPIADIHHIDAIGMGRDRKEFDDSNNLKVALCRKHHNEAHSIGWDEFSEKYHVKGVK